MANHAGIRRRHIAILVPIVAALAVVPIVSEANPNLLIVALILFWTLVYTALASSWNIIGGYAGQVSFGHSAFFGCGAYVVALLMTYGGSPYMALPLAGFLATFLAIPIGYPTFRLRGPFFSIATIGVGEIMRIIADNLEEVFRGGSSGLVVPVPKEWSVSGSYYLALILAAVSLFMSRSVVNSKFGLRLMAIRDNEGAAETLGVDVTRYKLLALMMSAFFVGLAGGAVALRTAYIYPDDVFSLTLSVVMILMPLIGGIGTLWGPVLGAIIFSIVDQLVSVSLPYLKLLIFGGIIVVVIIFEPAGLVGVTRKVAFRKVRASGHDRDERPEPA